MSDERRKDYMADGKLDQIQQSLHDQSLITERLVIITENQQKSIAAQEKWPEDHEKEFQIMSREVYSSQMQVAQWAEKLQGVESSLRDLAKQVGSLTETGLKIKGGWITVTLAAGMVMGAVTLIGNILKLVGN